MNGPSFADIARQYSLRELLRRYGVKIHPGGNFQCPYHDDKKPSCHIFRADDGRDMARCQSDRCGKLFDSVQLLADREHSGDLGLAAKALSGYQPMKPQPKPEDQTPEFHLGQIPEHLLPIPAGREFRYLTQKGNNRTITPDLVHIYRNKAGIAQAIVLRSKDHQGDKLITQIAWDALRSTFVGKGIKSYPLYHAEVLDRHDLPVLVVEGEKVVDLLAPLLHDWVVVTWAGGTGSVGRRDFSALDGRDVTWWPDADVTKPDEDEGAGEKAMRVAMKACKPRVSRWITPLDGWRELKSGYDAADLLAECGLHAVRDTITSFSHPVLEDAPQDPTSRPIDEDWLPAGLALDHTAKDTLSIKSETNCFLFLSFHPSFRGRFTFDLFDREVLIDGEIATEVRISMLAAELGAKCKLQVKHDLVGRHIHNLAQANPVNRFADLLRSLKWDGRTRYLLDYAGVEPDLWSQTVSRRWGVGLVRRILQPGVQHDGVLVLEGAQGIGKTSFLTALGRSFDRELLTTLHSLKLEGNNAMQLNGRAIVDMSEFTAHKRADAETFKALTTAIDDDYREPYARKYRKTPRTCIFAATTNNSLEYLNDPTGNRRIWPVKVTTRPDRDALARDIEQIWAELVYRATDEDEPNHLLAHEEPLQKSEAAKRDMVEPWVDIVEDVVGNAKIVTVANVWLALGMDGSRQKPHDHQRLSRIMRGMGFEKDQARYEGKNTKCWVRS